MHDVFMLSLITAILFGLIITFFAFQNSVLVPVTLGGYFLAGIPLYLVAIVSLLVGIMMAWFISAMEGMSHFMKLRRKDSIINSDKKELIDLRKKINDLESENIKLKHSEEKAAVENHNIAHKTEAPEDFTRKSSFLERLFPSSTRQYSKQS
jgi:uncharacterized integral membrane protein